jgi:hypothetical protein
VAHGPGGSRLPAWLVLFLFIFFRLSSFIVRSRLKTFPVPFSTSFQNASMSLVAVSRYCLPSLFLFGHNRDDIPL